MFWISVDKLQELVFCASPSLELIRYYRIPNTQYFCIVVITSLCNGLLTIVHLQVTPEPCPICDKFGDKTGIVQDNLCEEIEIHLRIQPSIVLRCFKVTFDAFIVLYFKTCFLCREQRCACLGYLVYLVLLSLIVGVHLVVYLGNVAFFSALLVSFGSLSA